MTTPPLPKRTKARGDTPGLTVDAILAAFERLEALLPVVHYHTHENAPLTGKDGTPLVCWFNRVEQPSLLDILEAPATVATLIIFHPDNLPEVQRQARGHCRLVPLTVTP